MDSQAASDSALPGIEQILALATSGRHAEALQQIEDQRHAHAQFAEHYWEIHFLELMQLKRFTEARDVICRAMQLGIDRGKGTEYYGNLIKAVLVPGRTCCLVGEDGFDMCVATNLILFYIELGFRVFLSRRIEPADLVVVTRFASPSKLDPSILQPKTPIHIYPHLGTSPRGLVEQLKLFPVSVFAPAAPLLSGCPGVFEQVALPPVNSAFWCCSAPERDIKFAHIGNLKPRTPADGEWPQRETLIRSLAEVDAHVWGNGWESYAQINNRRGAAALADVPPLYARIEFALGLMYPFQIASQTFSSRLWQAPLCGAKLICEREVAHRFPGVYPIGLDNVREKAAQITDSPESVQREAVAFWSMEWNRMKKLAGDSLYYAPPQTGGYIPPNAESRGNTFMQLRSGTVTEQLVFC